MKARTDCIVPRCGNAASRKGEHVTPQWLWNRLIDFAWAPVTSEDGSILKRDKNRRNQFMRAFLPICESCNKKLNDSFETRVKPVMKKLLGIGMPSDGSGSRLIEGVLPITALSELTEDEAQELGRWFIKTTVLLSHRETVWKRHGAPVGNKRDVDRFTNEVYQQLFSGVIPDGMHAWVAFSSTDQRDKPDDQNGPRILLGSIANSRFQAEGDSAAWYFTGTHGRVLHVQVAYQPGAIIVHPDVLAGTAFRLWPRPSAGLSIPSATVLSPQHADRFMRTFATRGGLFAASEGEQLVLAQHLFFAVLQEHNNHHHLLHAEQVDPAPTEQIWQHLVSQGFARAA
jgi:hypothetical protein